MRHKHQCFKCGCVWSHLPFTDRIFTDVEVKKAHECPRCHSRSVWNWQKYTADRLPDFIDHHISEKS